MKYVSEKYEAQLGDLAEHLMADKRELLIPAVGEVATHLQLELDLPEIERLYAQLPVEQ